jgi:hypothetical protein
MTVLLLLLVLVLLLVALLKATVLSASALPILLPVLLPIQRPVLLPLLHLITEHSNCNCLQQHPQTSRLKRQPSYSNCITPTQRGDKQPASVKEETSVLCGLKEETAVLCGHDGEGNCSAAGQAGKAVVAVAAAVVDQRVWIVLELCPHGTLDDLLSRYRQLVYPYCTHTVLIPVLILYSYPYSYCAHTVLIPVLILYSYCTHTVLIMYL